MSTAPTLIARSRMVPPDQNDVGRPFQGRLTRGPERPALRASRSVASRLPQAPQQLLRRVGLLRARIQPRDPLALRARQLPVLRGVRRVVRVGVLAVQVAII